MEKLLEKFNNKKMIENLVIFLILAIIVMIVINYIFDSHTEKIQTATPNQNEDTMTLVATVDENEEKLKNILSLINGAGEVNVMISYSNETEKIPMTDMKTTTTVINEKDSGGGERKTEETSVEESIIYEESNNTKQPVIKQKILPEMIGVIVVAEGARSATVRENIINAVEAVLEVPSHRIQVFAR